MALAIFDLDNTLLSGDSDYLWGVYLSEIGVVDRDEYEAKNLQFYEDYKQGVLDIHAFLSFSLAPLAAHAENDLLAWRTQFVEQKIKPLIGEKAQQLVEKHRQAGDTLLIITATNTFVTRPIADLFGIEQLIGTEPARDDEGYNGQVAGTPSFREGKITRLHDWLNERQENLDGAWFYSDSHNDLPLLQEVANPVAVDPDEKLAEHAQAVDWPVISLR